MSFLLAAISLGFLGSFHCIGMCGPISMALPVHQESPLRKTILIVIYNFGRMITYAALGALVGSLGQGIAIAGYQQGLSITIGILLLFSLLFPKLISSASPLGRLFSTLFSTLRMALSKLLKREGKSSLFTIGLLNGLLPCGLVYLGLAGAAAAGSIWKGALFMFVFGSGTLPVMLSLPLAGSFITVDARNQIRKTIPVIIGITAVLLILRGLNLGIPYVSPAIDKQSMSVTCHTSSDVHLQNSIQCSGQNSVHKK